MSYPQPSHYPPPQPPRKSSIGLIILVVILVVVVVAGLGGYAAYQIYKAAPSGGSSTSNGNTIQISGNSLTETVPIATDSTVQISCNYCTIVLQLSGTSVIADLQLSGNYNHVTVTGGQTDISISGNYNTVNAQQTTVLNVQNSGTGNTIQR